MVISLVPPAEVEKRAREAKAEERRLRVEAEKKAREARDLAQQALKLHSVRRATNVDYSPTRWPESPRVVMRCAHRASNGPDHLGL